MFCFNRRYETSSANWNTLESSGDSWWNWPGGLRDFISSWIYGIVALAVVI